VQKSNTLERIVPQDLELRGVTGRATLELHLERYRFAATYVRGPALLDIACGVGYGTHLLVQSCPEVKLAHGVDVSADAIAYARENYLDSRIHYIRDDAMNFHGLSAYDTIVSLETVEHIPSPDAFFSRLAGLLRPKGVLIASVPTTPSMDGNPHHLTDFTERSFKRLGLRAGLRESASFRQTQPFGPEVILSGREKRLERTRGDLAIFYAKNPQKLASRLWATIRYGFVNKYLTQVWVKPDY
jgi:SAM-dependent methyltransferase